MKLLGYVIAIDDLSTLMIGEKNRFANVLIVGRTKVRGGSLLCSDAKMIRRMTQQKT